jgi:hypothetical protein
MAPGGTIVIREAVSRGIVKVPEELLTDAATWVSRPEKREGSLINRCGDAGAAEKRRISGNC